MIKFIGVSIVGLLLAPVVHARDDFFSNPCSFYLDTEKALQCSIQPEPDRSDYLIRFGYLYCTRFLYHPKIRKNSALTLWADKTAACLIRQISEIATTASSCKDLEHQAYHSHAPCYAQSGFCDLPLRDQWKIFRVLRIRDWGRHPVRFQKQWAALKNICQAYPQE